MPTEQLRKHLDTVAVTGAGGFIGQHVVNRLRQAGITVHALVRSSTSSPLFSAPEVQTFRGDIRQPESLRPAFEEADAVIHLAARAREWGPRELFRAVNVEGTRHVIEAARQMDVQRVVHASSSVVYGYSYNDPHRGTTEDAPYAAAVTDNYSWSKIRAERICFDAIDAGQSCAIARLGWVWGPGDSTVLPRLLEFLRAPYAFYIGGGDNITDLAYVENVADVLCRMCWHPEAVGQAFNVHDGQRLTVREFITRLTDALDEGSPPQFQLPYAVVYPVAALCEWYARSVGEPGPPAISRYGIASLYGTLDFSVEKLRSRLSYRPPVDFEEALDRTAAWWANKESSGPGWQPVLHREESHKDVSRALTHSDE